VRKRYVQTPEGAGKGAGGRTSRKHAGAADLVFVGYGLSVLFVVAASYAAGAFGFLPHDPEALDLSLLLMPPGTPGHILGTDFMGRDILSRLILGIQAYFLPGLLAVATAVVPGAALGVLAGLRGGRTDDAIAWFLNLVDSFPRLVLILLVVAAFRPSILAIMAVAGLTNIPAAASLVRGKVLFLREKSFIEAAVAIGLPIRVIVARHILWHHCRAVLIVRATLGMAEAILLETSLSYLGFGVQEPVPSWGNMVQSGANYLLQGAFWPSTVPAIAILLTILGFHLLGDGLNNILERKGAR
jgi:peptide/nickel transport system permease protein